MGGKKTDSRREERKGKRRGARAPGGRRHLPLFSFLPPFLPFTTGHRNSRRRRGCSESLDEEFSCPEKVLFKREEGERRENEKRREVKEQLTFDLLSFFKRFFSLLTYFSPCKPLLKTSMTFFFFFVL